MVKGFNSLLERFLVFMTVTSFMLSIAFLMTPVLNNPEFERIFINWVSYIIIFVSGFVFIIIQQIFAREKIKPYLHIVVIVFYVIAAVILCGLTKQMNLPYVLIPFLIIQYFVENALNNMFAYHDIFIIECGELSGKELETHLFHNNLSAIDFGAKAKIYNGVLVILPCILFIMIYIVLKTNHNFGLFALITIIVFFISVFFCFYILAQYKNDVFFGFLGFRNHILNKRRLFRSVFVILVTAIIFGVLFSSNKALIKISLKPVNDSKVNNQIQELPKYAPMEYQILAENLEEMFANQKSLIPDWVFELIYGIIKGILISGLVIGLVMFFFKPFFTAHWKQFWQEGRLLKFFKHIIDELKEFLHYLFIHSDKEDAYAAVSVEGKRFGEGIKDFLKRAGRSKEKNAEIDRLTKHFMKLIDWGEAHKIHYHTNLAPAEYTALINKDSALIAGELFEKALYDKNVLTSQEEKDFIEAVRKVVLCE